MDEAETADAAERIRTINDLSSVPTIYADGCIFAANLGGMVKLSFVEHILSPADSDDPGFKLRHIVNLAMPRDGFVSMYQYLSRIAADLGVVQNGEPEQPADA